jgi:hypothetical protein
MKSEILIISILASSLSFAANINVNVGTRIESNFDKINSEYESELNILSIGSKLTSRLYKKSNTTLLSETSFSSDITQTDDPEVLKANLDSKLIYLKKLSRKWKFVGILSAKYSNSEINQYNLNTGNIVLLDSETGKLSSALLTKYKLNKIFSFDFGVNFDLIDEKNTYSIYRDEQGDNIASSLFTSANYKINKKSKLSGTIKYKKRFYRERRALSKFGEFVTVGNGDQTPDIIDNLKIELAYKFNNKILKTKLSLSSQKNSDLIFGGRTYDAKSLEIDTSYKLKSGSKVSLNYEYSKRDYLNQIVLLGDDRLLNNDVTKFEASYSFPKLISSTNLLIKYSSEVNISNRSFDEYDNNIVSAQLNFKR